MGLLDKIGGVGGFFQQKWANDLYNQFTGNSSMNGGIGGQQLSHNAYIRQAHMYKNSIQWRVEDAKKAGIHPLAALGAPVASYSPVSVGGQSQPKQNLLRSLAKDGQNAMSIALMQAQIDNINADTTQKLAGISGDDEGNIGMKGSGQATSQTGSNIQVDPVVTQKRIPGIPGINYGNQAAAQLEMNMDGSMSIVPSMSAQERTSENMFEYARWFYSNSGRRKKVLDYINKNYPAKPGYTWDYAPTFNRILQRKVRNTKKGGGTHFIRGVPYTPKN